MKFISKILILIGIKKPEPEAITVVPVKDRTDAQLKKDVMESKNTIEKIQGELKPVVNLYNSINAEIVKRLSPIQYGDIIQLIRKRGISFSYLVTVVIYDPEVKIPIPEFRLICRTFKSSEHSFKLGDKDILIGGEHSLVDLEDIEDIHVERNIYDKSRGK